MTEEHRTKIANSQILNRLIKCASGEIEMNAVQASVGLGLLRKVLPDLSQADNKTEVVHRYVARLPEKAKTTDTWLAQRQQEGKTTTH